MYFLLGKLNCSASLINGGAYDDDIVLTKNSLPVWYNTFTVSDNQYEQQIPGNR